MISYLGHSYLPQLHRPETPEVSNISRSPNVTAQETVKPFPSYRASLSMEALRTWLALSPNPSRCTVCD